MNLLTSLFNAGIYKNCVRRFKWGAFIYFVMLFFCVPFVFMVNTPDAIQNISRPAAAGISCVLFQDVLFILPMLIAVAVPTVVALLVFNYVHSPKQGIFTHTLPATRKEIYISSCAAAFTLMAIPVLLNMVILFVLNACGYGTVLGGLNIIKWAMIQLFILFVMFSVCAAASFLTGNSFALVAIIVIINLLPLVVYFAISLLSSTFLYGYADTSNEIARKLVEYTPVVWISNRFERGFYNQELFSDVAAWVYIAVAAVLYAAGLVLCKIRKVENCGDVAAFNVFKPILKYTVTAAAATAIFGILRSMALSAVVIFAVAAVLCAIVYFACEMLLGKTFKVFGKYKGYLVFCGCVAAILAFFAYTSVLGFETKIPDKAQVESATICTTYAENKPFSNNEKSIDATIEIHRELIKTRPITPEKRKDGKRQQIDITYNLKNGKTMIRRYLVTDEMYERAKNKMFEFEDYKLAYTEMDTLNIDNADTLNLEIALGSTTYNIALNEDAKPFLRAVEQDIKNITFTQYEQRHVLRIRTDISIAPEKIKENGIFIPDGREYYYNFNMAINRNFKNAISFLEEKGYLQQAKNYIAKNIYIYSEKVQYFEKEKAETLDAKKLVKLDEADALKLIEDYGYSGNTPLAEGENYVIFSSADMSGRIYTHNNNLCFNTNPLPEYLKKYIK